MTTLPFALVAVGVAVCVWAAWRLRAALATRRTLAGVRLVTCPETGRVAAVRFDRMRAALTGFAHEPDVRLSDCSRWVVRGPCDQPCLPYAALPDSSATTLVGRWSAEKRCALCGRRLVDAPQAVHHIALRSPDGVTREWTDLPPEDLPDALRTRWLVCGNCHIVETFRRQHPDLITDR